MVEISYFGTRRQVTTMWKPPHGSDGFGWNGYSGVKSRYGVEHTPRTKDRDPNAVIKVPYDT